MVLTNVSLHRGFFIIVLDLRLTKFGLSIAGDHAHNDLWVFEAMA